MISIILASGQGSRLRPLSSYIPKVLLPVRGKPVLDYILADLKKLNIDTNYIVVSEHKSTVERYLKEMKLDSCKTINGLEWESGGDLALALEQVEPTGDVIVMNGDIVADVDMAEVYADHICHPKVYATMAITRVEEKQAKRFGRVTYDTSMKVTQFSEKEQGKDESNMVNMGFYVFDRQLVKERRSYLPLRKFKYEPELYPRLASEGVLYASDQKPSYFWDIGTIDSYLEAEDSLRV